MIPKNKEKPDLFSREASVVGVGEIVTVIVVVEGVGVVAKISTGATLVIATIDMAAANI